MHVQVQKLHGIGMEVTGVGTASFALEDYAVEHQRVLPIRAAFSDSCD